jgi:uncharacterized coiled-coil protein SlyX
MKYAKTLIFAYILPFIVVLNACQNSDKQTPQNEKNIGSIDYQTPPSTLKDEDVSSPKDNLSLRSGDKKQDGDIKQVNYQQQTENYNTQDKRMIIRSGTMNLEAESFGETELKVKQISGGLGGYITNSSAVVNPSGKKQGAITIRVAADKFDMLIDELGKIGKVMNQNISGRDVTEEFMDSEAQLKTQQELEARLLKLLSEKTANLSAIVEVEQKLAAVRENIEKTQGRMRMLKDQASYSTLTVSIFEPAILNTSSGGGFFYELGLGIEKGLSGFTSVLSGIITIIIALSPVIVIFGLIIYIVVKYIKKRKLVKT